MKKFKGLIIPEHTQSDDIVKCCITAGENVCGCTCVCYNCLFSHINNYDKKWIDNIEIFNQWLQLGRPCEICEDEE